MIVRLIVVCLFVFVLIVLLTFGSTACLGDLLGMSVRTPTTLLCGQPFVLLTVTIGLSESSAYVHSKSFPALSSQCLGLFRAPPAMIRDQWRPWTSQPQSSQMRGEPNLQRANQSDPVLEDIETFYWSLTLSPILVSIPV